MPGLHLSLPGLWWNPSFHGAHNQVIVETFRISGVVLEGKIEALLLLVDDLHVLLGFSAWRGHTCSQWKPFACLLKSLSRYRTTGKRKPSYKKSPTFFLSLSQALSLLLSFCSLSDPPPFRDFFLLELHQFPSAIG